MGNIISSRDLHLKPKQWIGSGDPKQPLEMESGYETPVLGARKSLRRCPTDPSGCVSNHCPLWSSRVPLVELLSPMLFFFSLFIYFERKREMEEQKERGRERIPSRLCAVSADPDTGVNLTTMRLEPKSKARHLTN